MKGRKPSRRDILQGAAGLAAGTVFATPVRAQAPEPVAITPALVEAASRGELSWRDVANGASPRR